MKKLLFLLPVSVVSTASALDDFNVQMLKVMHEEVSERAGVYTATSSAEIWNPDSEWFRNPGVAVRFEASHQRRDFPFFPGDIVEIDIYRPMVGFNFQTIGGIEAGITYGHAFLYEERTFAFPRDVESDMDSVGGYLAKQFDCGFRIGGSWSYSDAEFRFDGNDDPFFEYDTVGAAAGIGFARSFGEKTFGRNVFIDTSANFVYQDLLENVIGEDEEWTFLWLAKVGHNICEEFAIYGLFNLYHDLNDRIGGRVIEYGGLRPYGDDTWAEMGGGFETHFGGGFTFRAEAVTPVLDQEFTANEAFQVRAALNFRF